MVKYRYQKQIQIFHHVSNGSATLALVESKISIMKMEDLFKEIFEIEVGDNNKFYSIVKQRPKRKASVKSNQSTRDLTKYMFTGQQYNKSRLALAIISYYCKKNKPNFKDLCEIFPVELISPYGLFQKRKRAIELSKKQD